jgi:hypothetical protein
MLIDPHDALDEQNAVVHALVGLAGLARTIHALGVRQPVPAHVEADDFVHLLVGLADLGDAVGRLVPPDEPRPAEPSPVPPWPGPMVRDLLR